MLRFLILLASTTALTNAAASSYEQLDKRQEGDLEITIDGKGGFLESKMPLVCVKGCEPALTNFELCDQLNTTRTGAGPNRPGGIYDPLHSRPCNWLCVDTNYMGFTQCINCIVANGGGGDMKELQDGLTKANQFCQGRIQPTITEITATPTTTGATQASFTESTLTLPVWTGLTSFVAVQSREAVTQVSSGTSSTSQSASVSTSSAASTSGAATPVIRASVRGKSLGYSGVVAACIGLVVF